MPSDFLLDFCLISGNGVFFHPSLGPSTLSQQENMWLTAGFHLFLFVDACIMAEMLQLFCSNNIAPEPNICQLELFSDSSTTTSTIVEAFPHILSTMQYSPVKSVSLHLVGSTRSDVADSVSLVFLMLSVSSQDKIHW